MQKKDVYQEKTNFWVKIFYYIIVVGLIITIGLMYREWEDRKVEYTRMVQEASAQDQSKIIELHPQFSEADEEVTGTEE